MAEEDKDDWKKYIVEEQSMQYASQPKKVIEIEQKDLKGCLENLKENSKIEFTEDHKYVYNKLMNLASTDAVIDNNDKLLVAKNEQDHVVGIGSACFNDRKRSPNADLDLLLSVEKSAGRAIVNAIIDYSRQMENRADLNLLPINEGLIPYYSQFKFARHPQGLESLPWMVRQKSGEFDPSLDVTTFQPLEKTRREIENKRSRAMSR